MLRAIMISTAALALSASGAAYAQDQNTQTYKVNYADLDLTTAAGRHTLERRVSFAVKQVCGDPDLRDLQGVRESTTCRQAAASNANTQIALAASKAGQAVALRSSSTPVRTARLSTAR